MRIEFLEKNYKIEEKFRNITTEKVSKLYRYFGSDVTIRIMCSKQNKTEKLEVTIMSKGVIYRGEASGLNMYENIDLVLPKIEKQIIRKNQKEIQKSRQSKPVTYEFLTEEPEITLPDVVKKKSFDLTPITVEEAKDAIERLGHNFYLFLNSETGFVNVIYRRNDGKFGIIEGIF